MTDLLDHLRATFRAAGPTYVGSLADLAHDAIAVHAGGDFRVVRVDEHGVDVPLDDERLQAVADLAERARDDAEWRRSVTAALCGLPGGTAVPTVAVHDAEQAARDGRHDAHALIALRDGLDQLLQAYRLRDDTALHFAGGVTPDGPVFTSALARDVHDLLDVTKGSTS